MPTPERTARRTPARRKAAGRWGYWGAGGVGLGGTLVFSRSKGCRRIALTNARNPRPFGGYAVASSRRAPLVSCALRGVFHVGLVGGGGEMPDALQGPLQSRDELAVSGLMEPYRLRELVSPSLASRGKPAGGRLLRLE